MSYDGGQRRTWLTVQLLAVVVAVVLALPGMRRQKGAIEGAAHDADDATGPDLPVVGSRRAARLREPEPVGAGTVGGAPLSGPAEYVQPQPLPAEYMQPLIDYREPTPPGDEVTDPPPDQFTKPFALYDAGGQLNRYDQGVTNGAGDAEQSAGERPARHGGGRRKGGRRARRGGALSDTVDESSSSGRRSESKGGRRAKGRRRQGGDS